MAKKKLSKKRIALICTSVFLALILLAGGIFYGLTFHDANAVLSIKKVKSGLYTMNYNGGFYLDRYLDQGGAKSEEELKTFLARNLMMGLGSGAVKDITPPEQACSSFTAVTSGGDQLHARNLDSSDYSDVGIVFTKPKGRYKSVSTVHLGYVGVNGADGLSTMEKMLMLSAPYITIDGMNEKGVCINVNSLYAEESFVNANTEKVDVITTVMMRLVLDYAKNVDEAIEIFKTYDLHDSIISAFHYQVSDASGDSAIIEFYNGEMQVLRKGDADYLHQTNFELNEHMIERSDDETFSMWRYKKIADKLDATGGVLSEVGAMELLGDVEETHTNWSVVYNKTKLTATIKIHGKFEQVGHSYSL